jgi:hypothetical protein
MPVFPIAASTCSATTGGGVVGQPGSVKHRFNKNAVFGFGALQSIQFTNSNMDGANVLVTEFVDDNGKHPISDVAFFSPDDSCTSVTYTIFVGIAAASAICITQMIPQLTS